AMSQPVAPDKLTRYVAASVLIAAGCHPALATETCRYTGTASHGARIQVETTASRANGIVTVDVAADVTVRWLGFLKLRYLYQEISTWRGSEMTSVGINYRQLFSGMIQRQQWDFFHRGPEGLTSWRAQGKTVASLREKHAALEPYWDPITFGRPWLQAFHAA